MKAWFCIVKRKKQKNVTGYTWIQVPVVWKKEIDCCLAEWSLQELFRFVELPSALWALLTKTRGKFFLKFLSVFLHCRPLMHSRLEVLLVARFLLIPKLNFLVARCSLIPNYTFVTFCDFVTSLVMTFLRVSRPGCNWTVLSLIFCGFIFLEFLLELKLLSNCSRLQSLGRLWAIEGRDTQATAMLDYECQVGNKMKKKKKTKGRKWTPIPDWVECLVPVLGPMLTQERKPFQNTRGEGQENSPDGHANESFLVQPLKSAVHKFFGEDFERELAFEQTLDVPGLIWVAENDRYAMNHATRLRKKTKNKVHLQNYM